MTELSGAATAPGQATPDAAPQRPGAKDGEPTPRARIAAAIQSSAAVIVLVVVTLLGAIAFGPKFASVNNLLNIVEDSSFLALLAIGMTFVIMGGGIDLSVGSVLALGGVVAAWAGQNGDSLFALTVPLVVGVDDRPRERRPHRLGTHGAVHRDARGAALRPGPGLLRRRQRQSCLPHPRRRLVQRAGQG